MTVCCCVSDEPIEDVQGRIRSFPLEDGRVRFQASLLDAPTASWSSCCWFQSQYFIPCCAQYFLRKKVLGGDLAGRYRCFQGYFTICCIQGGACREDECPDFCAFLEGCMCNCVAISASRLYVMDKYNLASDPCDYRLIRINNCIQGMACICGLLAIFNKDLRKLARFLDCAADASYHVMSGCMTAQVAYEVDYQNTHFPDRSNDFSSSLSHRHQSKHMEMGGRHPSPYQSYEHSLGHGHVPSECVAAAVAVPVQEGSQHLLAEKEV